MSVEDVSFAIMALNVFGGFVSPITNLPPYVPIDGTGTVMVSSGSGLWSTNRVDAPPRLPQPVRPKAAPPITATHAATERAFVLMRPPRDPATPVRHHPTAGEPRVPAPR